jgi:hypothetical protein
MNALTLIREHSNPSGADIAPTQRPAPVLFTEEAALCDWIAHAVPGALMIYFRGYLACDRMPSQSPFGDKDRKRLVAVANRALRAAEDGLVHLIQRRHGPQDYSCIAVKARGRLKARVIPTPTANAGGGG